MSSIRRRFRDHVKVEVKEAALRMLANGGPEAVSVNAIAKELGVSGPALYRYFASRDDLLADLIEDAYDDFSVALDIARQAETEPADRFRALARSYRSWATNEPHRYRVLFRAPLHGFEAQSERFVNAAQYAMTVTVEVLSDLAPTSPASAVTQLAISAWTRIHGFVSLEIEGNYASMALDADHFFGDEVEDMLSSISVRSVTTTPR